MVSVQLNGEKHIKHTNRLNGEPWYGLSGYNELIV